MTSLRRRTELPGSRSSQVADGADDLRRMVLLLETADVLERRARRTSDPAKVSVLLRRSEQRRREATQLRERLAARGAALNKQQAAVARGGLHEDEVRGYAPPNEPRERARHP